MSTWIEDLVFHRKNIFLEKVKSLFYFLEKMLSLKGWRWKEIG